MKLQNSSSDDLPNHELKRKEFGAFSGIHSASCPEKGLRWGGGHGRARLAGACATRPLREPRTASYAFIMSVVKHLGAGAAIGGIALFSYLYALRAHTLRLLTLGTRAIADAELKMLVVQDEIAKMASAPRRSNMSKLDSIGEELNTLGDEATLRAMIPSPKRDGGLHGGSPPSQPSPQSPPSPAQQPMRRVKSFPSVGDAAYQLLRSSSAPPMPLPRDLLSQEASEEPLMRRVQSLPACGGAVLKSVRKPKVMAHLYRTTHALKLKPTVDKMLKVVLKPNLVDHHERISRASKALKTGGIWRRSTYQEEVAGAITEFARCVEITLLTAKELADGVPPGSDLFLRRLASSCAQDTFHQLSMRGAGPPSPLADAEGGDGAGRLVRIASMVTQMLGARWQRARRSPRLRRLLAALAPRKNSEDDESSKVFDLRAQAREDWARVMNASSVLEIDLLEARRAMDWADELGVGDDTLRQTFLQAVMAQHEQLAQCRVA